MPHLRMWVESRVYWVRWGRLRRHWSASCARDFLWRSEDLEQSDFLRRCEATRKLSVTQRVPECDQMRVSGADRQFPGYPLRGAWIRHSHPAGSMDWTDRGLCWSVGLRGPSWSTVTHLTRMWGRWGGVERSADGLISRRRNSPTLLRQLEWEENNNELK